MKTLESILAEHPFFKEFAPEYLQLMKGCASNAFYRAGTHIFREDEDASHFYVIRQGKVALEISAGSLGMITIETLDAGEVLGWSWLFPPYRWHFSARAVEPTRVTMLDGICLRTKCNEDHDLGYELVRQAAAVMMQRLQATRLQLLDAYAYDPRARSRL